MQTANIRFYGELNFFLPQPKRNQSIVYAFSRRNSIKDALESLGPPHCEIEAILVNGRPVNFDYIVVSGDEIEVYDQQTSPAISAQDRLRPVYNKKPRFVLDTHLGRLASYLRMLGFDTLYRNDYPDDELAQISDEEARILLTRDIGLLKRGRVTYGYYVRETKPKRRISEVMRRFELEQWIEPYKHCIKCNGLLHPVEKNAILHQLPPRTSDFYQEFHQCQSCGQIYWKGSHFDRMQTFLDEVMQDKNAPPQQPEA